MHLASLISELFGAVVQWSGQIGHMLWATALLVPIGVIGMTRWLMWLSKRIPALFYRPIENDFDCTATIITPVYNEDPKLFVMAIESWLRNKPDRIIAVIDVTDKKCMAIARGYYPLVEVIPIDIPGKRAALAAGVDASRSDIVVLVDSDVIWEPDVLAKIKMPFADPKIGGVGTRQNMYPTDGVKATVWERMADIYLDIRYTDEVPATTLLGRAVSCLSGRTAAYRTKLLQRLREPFLNETFNGRTCMSGDDKRYTCLVLQSGYLTWNQLNAQVYSTFKPDFEGFCKQRIRWSRNSFRSDLRALWQGWVWRYPFLAFMLIDKTVAPFTLLVGPIVLVLAIVIGHWELVLALLVWWFLSRAFKIWPHLRRRPADWLILPIFLAMTYYMSLVKAYALCTLNEHKWLTRAVAVVHGEVRRVSETAQSRIE
jgi:hyaluronan synthase